MSLEALIFDVDGTLADTEEAHRQAFNQAFCAFGLDWEWTPERYRDLLRVTGGKERIASHLESLRVESPERGRLQRLIPEIHAAKTRYYTLRVRLGRVRPRAGVSRLLSEARAAGVRLAIASTTSPKNVEALLAASFGAEALSWFEAIVTGDVVARKKPAPDVYLQALAVLDLHAAQAIALEDSAIGVQAAKGAGLFALAMPSPWTRHEDFSGADLVLPSLAAPDLDTAYESRFGAGYVGLAYLAGVHAAFCMPRGTLMPVKMDQIRAVAFDLDGTLIDTLPDLAGAVNATLTALGAHALPQARVKELVGDGADKLIERAVAEALTGGAATAATQAQALELFLAYYAEQLFSRSRVYPEAMRTLRALEAKAIRVCCVTNKSSRFALPLLEQAGLARLLEFTLCADRTEDRKPSPVLLLQACERLELIPRELLYVGDSHTDVMAAHAAGCGAVAVTFGYHKSGSLERVGPDVTVATLIEIVSLCCPEAAPGAPHIQEVPT
jgi:2-phosphoglycolate phosphatase